MGVPPVRERSVAEPTQRFVVKPCVKKVLPAQIIYEMKNVILDISRKHMYDSNRNPYCHTIGKRKVDDMPHSSGGGSHSGGSHGGSHGGSFHSSSSRSSGSGYRSSAPRVSRSYYAGAHRYVYYSMHRPVYYYSSKKVDASNWKKTAISTSIVMVVWLLFGFFLCCDGFFPPKPLPLDYKETDLIITDDASVLTDGSTDDIYTTFQEFQKTTGITPALLTTYDETWKGYYNTLEDYAYDVYVNWFDDESHWLIVYSEPEYHDPTFTDWKWEGMQGNDTDRIITEDLADQLTASVQKYLTRQSCSVGESIVRGFRDLMPNLMRAHPDPETVILFFLMFVLPALYMGYRVFEAIRSRKQAKAVKCQTDQGQILEDKCEYCGGIYVHGLHESCPHCGAPIRKA